MRKTLTALFIAAALPTFAMAAPAANDLPPPPMEGGHMMGQHGPRHGGPMKELDLTREQRQQMGKLMGEQMRPATRSPSAIWPSCRRPSRRP